MISNKNPIISYTTQCIKNAIVPCIGQTKIPFVFNVLNKLLQRLQWNYDLFCPMKKMSLPQLCNAVNCRSNLTNGIDYSALKHYERIICQFSDCRAVTTKIAALLNLFLLVHFSRLRNF